MGAEAERTREDRAAALEGGGTDGGQRSGGRRSGAGAGGRGRRMFGEEAASVEEGIAIAGPLRARR